MPLTFPTHLFNPAAVILRPVGSVLEGGESLDGETDTIRTDGGGHWRVTLSGIQLIDPDLIRAWRVWEDHLDGGTMAVLVPVVDIRQAPRPMIGGQLARPSALLPQSDNPYFPEALGFATPLIEATVVAGAALRATQLEILIARGARLRGGEIFALNHAEAGRRIYRVGQVISRAGQSAVVTIRPPLREAVEADQAADFDWPSLKCTLIPNSEISPMIENARHASVDISFREAR